MATDELNTVQVAADVCCALTKADLPQVQAVLHILIPIVEQAWSDMLDRIADDVADLQQDELGPEWILFLGEAAFQAAIAGWRPYVLSIFHQAATMLLPLGGRVNTAARNLQFMVRGRLYERSQDLMKLLSLRLPRQELRRRLEEDLVPANRWSHVLTHSWAYGWHWVGKAQQAVRYLAPNQQDARVFRYQNPLDEKTTPFCNWLVRTGKTFTYGDVRRQLNRVETAMAENDIKQFFEARPMLTFTGRETSSDFEEIYRRVKVFLPPFHWSCRTEIEQA